MKKVKTPSIVPAKYSMIPPCLMSEIQTVPAHNVLRPILMLLMNSNNLRSNKNFNKLFHQEKYLQPRQKSLNYQKNQKMERKP